MSLSYQHVSTYTPELGMRTITGHATNEICKFTILCSRYLSLFPLTEDCPCSQFLVFSSTIRSVMIFLIVHVAQIFLDGSPLNEFHQLHLPLWNGP
jgi:hypothetical protein